MTKSSPALNDIELQRLKRKIPDLTPEVLETFDRALRCFRDSTRYVFFHRMRVGEFLPGLEGNFFDATFSDLVEMGTLKICEREGVSTKLLTRLASVLEQFRDDQQEELSEPQNLEDVAQLLLIGDRAGKPVERLRNPKVPFYSSIEAEAKISEGFRRLTAAERFAEFQSRKVSEFWDPEVVRAPFLEALTIKELTSIAVDDLLKKRSVGNAKIHVLLGAINRCLREHNEPELSKGPIGEFASHAGADYLRDAEEIPREDEPSQPVLSEKEVDCAAVEARYQLLHLGMHEKLAAAPASLCAQLYDNLTVDSRQLFLELFWQIDVARRAEKTWSGDWLCFGEDVSPLRNLLEGAAPEAVRAWRSLLASAAVTEESLLSPYLDSGLSEELQTIFFRVCLFVVGARPPKLREQVLRGHWSCQPEALGKIVDSIVTTLPKDDQSLQTDLNIFLPQADAAGLVEFLKETGVMKLVDGEWVSK